MKAPTPPKRQRKTMLEVHASTLMGDPAWRNLLSDIAPDTDPIICTQRIAAYVSQKLLGANDRAGQKNVERVRLGTEQARGRAAYKLLNAVVKSDDRCHSEMPAIWQKMTSGIG